MKMDLLMNACCKGYNHRGLSNVSENRTKKNPQHFAFFLLVFCWCVDWIWKFVCDSREKWCHLWGLIKMTETTAYFYWYFNHKSSIIFNRLKWWWIIKMTIVFCKKIIHFFPIILINITVAPNVWKCHKVVTDQISTLQLIVATESSYCYKMFSSEQANVHQNCDKRWRGTMQKSRPTLAFCSECIFVAVGFLIITYGLIRTTTSHSFPFDTQMLYIRTYWAYLMRSIRPYLSVTFVWVHSVYNIDWARHNDYAGTAHR